MAYQEKEGAKPENEDEEILEDARKYLKECVDEEEPERRKMKDDLHFCALDQWPSEIRNERENDVENGPRPCLTIDKINQYIVQVVNDVRQGKPGINVRPQDDKADVQTAKLLKGLVRNIEDQSNADIAYATAVENAAKIGLGYFRIKTEYVDDESFDQEIFISPIPNTFAVHLGKHIMPDGSDAEVGFVTEAMPIETFKATFPKAKCDPKDFEGVDTDVIGYWKTDKTITVVEFFCIKRTAEELYYLEDGTTMPKKMYEEWPAEAGPRPGIEDRRTTIRRQLKWAKMTAIQVLEKRDLPGKYIPIVEVIGRETWVDGKRVLWGLVRPAKDSLRMYNYWASTLTEKFGLAPKTPFIGAKGQFENLEDKWKKANRLNYPYLEYNPIDVNGNALPAPQRQGPTPIEAAYFQQMQVIEHDVQTSLGMFKAAVGETESQQSGRAILALQRESDTGTYHFGANLGVSIRHAGRIIVDLIPHYYDTERIVRILGEDGEVQTAKLDPNLQTSFQQSAQPGMAGVFNPGVGKYDVSITVGPSYNTKRMEAAATFVELAKGASDPGQAAVLGYLTVRNSDFNGAEEAAKMMKALLPPAVAQAISPEGQQMPPQAVAQITQLTQVAQALKQENEELQSGAKVQQTKIVADAQANQQKIEATRQEAAAKIALERAIAEEKAKLAREIAETEAQLKRDIATAEHGLAKQKLEFDKEKTSFEQATKLEEKAKAEQAPLAENIVPKFAETLQSMTQAFTQALDQQVQTSAAIVDALNKPKTVRLSGIQGSGGGITGATATVQ